MFPKVTSSESRLWLEQLQQVRIAGHTLLPSLVWANELPISPWLGDNLVIEPDCDGAFTFNPCLLFLPFSETALVATEFLNQLESSYPSPQMLDQFWNSLTQWLANNDADSETHNLSHKQERLHAAGLSATFVRSMFTDNEPTDSQLARCLADYQLLKQRRGAAPGMLAAALLNFR